MRCPSCGNLKSMVVDSRPSSDGTSIRRRRECPECQKRFTTYEYIETVPLTVIKKDKSRVSFDRNKILGSVIRACDKRQVSRNEMDALVTSIELELQNSLQSEVTTALIGEMVMERLKTLDEVAYIRFASVYRKFKDVRTFAEELNKILLEKDREYTAEKSGK